MLKDLFKKKYHMRRMLEKTVYSDFEKNQGFVFREKYLFFQKNIYFSKKTPNFKRFESSYYSSLILRQICCNLRGKIISRSDVNKNADASVNAIGKHRMKKHQK